MQISVSREDRSQFSASAKYLLIGAYLLSVIVRAFIASKFGAPKSVNGDEDVYISLAQSIFRNHSLFFKGSLFDFSSLLYPLYLSMGYLFYRPDAMIFMFRIMGIVSMSLAVFPSYWLAKDLTGDSQRAFLIAVLSIIIPEMVLSFWILSEVLYYPLIILGLFLVYRSINNQTRDVKTSILLGISAFLVYYSKELGSAFVVSCILFFAIGALFEKDKSKAFLCLASGLFAFIAMYIGSRFLHDILRGREPGGIAYANVILVVKNAIHNISSFYDFCINILNGLAYYTFNTLVGLLFFPVIFVYGNIKNLEKTNGTFARFIALLYLITILQVVIIYVMEGGVSVVPQRVHFRYLFPFTIPIFALFASLEIRKLRLTGRTIMIGLFFFSYMLFFPHYLSRRMGSPIDASRLNPISVMLNEYFSNDRRIGFLGLEYFVSFSILAVLVFIFWQRKIDFRRTRRALLVTMFGVMIILSFSETLLTKKYDVASGSPSYDVEFKKISRLVYDNKSPIAYLASLPNQNLRKELLGNYLYNQMERIVYVPGQFEYPLATRIKYVVIPKNDIVMPYDSLRLIDSKSKMFDLYEEIGSENILKLQKQASKVSDIGKVLEGLREIKDEDSAKIDSYNGNLYDKRIPIVIEKAKSAGLALIGWAVDKAARGPGSSIYLWINNSYYEAEYGLSRLDVARLFKIPKYEKTGFKLVLSLGSLREGEYKARLVVMSETARYYYTSSEYDILIK
jgi:hypothetical protein